jgi:hypothetical protein
MRTCQQRRAVRRSHRGAMGIDHVHSFTRRR